jgi:hypothetical protein
MKASAVIERAGAPSMRFGDFVAAVSLVAEEDAAELVGALLASGRAQFIRPGALDELASLSRSPRRAPRSSHSRTRSAASVGASRAS